MYLFQALFFGFGAALIGALPPGLLNMTAFKISHRDGFNRALWFVLGASIIIVFQTYLAVVFGRFLYYRTDINEALQEFGIVIFLLISIYFFWTHFKKKVIKTEQIKIRSKSSRFVVGMLLSALNLFPIPYYAVLSLTLSSYGWFSFDNDYLILFSIGSALAAFGVFMFYAWFFNRKVSKKSVLFSNINLILAILTLLVAVIGIFNFIMA